MLDVVLLELEGVLVDTREARVRALIEALAAEGVVLDVSNEGEALGLPPRAAAECILKRAEYPADDTTLDLIAVRAERVFTSHVAAGVTLQRGARELIAEIQSRARLGLVTRARRRDVDAIMALSELDAAFEVIIAAENVMEYKPAPDGYRAALEHLMRRRHVVLGNVVALEDSLAGIRAAKGALLRCIAVGDLPAHAAMEADGYVPSLEGQTLDTLDRLSSRGEERVG